MFTSFRNPPPHTLLRGPPLTDKLFFPSAYRQALFPPHPKQCLVCFLFPSYGLSEADPQACLLPTPVFFFRALGLLTCEFPDSFFPDCRTPTPPPSDSIRPIVPNNGKIEIPNPTPSQTPLYCFRTTGPPTGFDVFCTFPAIGSFGLV